MRTLPFIIALFFVTGLQAASACNLEMNGKWSLNPQKSLDPEGLEYEVLVFTNTISEQRYFMEYQDGPDDKGSLEWSVPCDGDDHPSADFPWNNSPDSTVAVMRLGEKSEYVIQKSAGVLTTTYTRVLADDNQTLISVGRDAAGKIVWVRVFDREN